MGRPRLRHKHLPRRMYQRRGAFYFVDRSGEWHPLGRRYTEALGRYAQLLEPIGEASLVAEVAAMYVREVLPKKSPTTAAGRRQQFKQLMPCFGHMRCEAIEPHHVWRYYRERGESEQARHEVRGLSALLTYARQLGALKKSNPCYGLRLAGSPPRRRYVTDAEFLAVRELAPAMIGYAMDFALAGGLDTSTILKLERRHVTATGLAFTRGKTGAEQIVDGEELVLTAKAALRESPQLRQFIICRRDGRPYTASGFQSIWQRLMRRALKSGALSERYHFHDLRAKSASDAESDAEAAARLGHSDEAITKRVYRRLPRRATALRILDTPERIGR